MFFFLRHLLRREPQCGWRISRPVPHRAGRCSWPTQSGFCCAWEPRVSQRWSVIIHQCLGSVWWCTMDQCSINTPTSRWGKCIGKVHSNTITEYSEDLCNFFLALWFLKVWTLTSLYCILTQLMLSEFQKGLIISFWVELAVIFFFFLKEIERLLWFIPPMSWPGGCQNAFMGKEHSGVFSSDVSYVQVWTTINKVLAMFAYVIWNWKKGDHCPLWS